MPTSEAPSNVPATETDPEQGSTPNGDGLSAAGNGNGAGSGSLLRGTSRWVDYDSHELLEMISELEDERRWARLREGVLWAVLFHILLLLALFLAPRYLHMTPVIDANNIQSHKDFTYLDTPFVPRPKPVPPLKQMPQIDRKTLEELKKESEAPPAAAAPAPPVQQATVEPKPQPAALVPPKAQSQSQSQVEAPRPAAVPARPNFAQLEHNPTDQLQQEMRNAMRGGGEAGTQAPAMGGLPMHPGAGTGGVQILSDTQGVDFNAWLAAWYYETRRTWDPLIPDECNPPINKQGQVMIDFKVLPNGRLVPLSETLIGRSGDVALDRAAWGALSGSSYPPLPRQFHGPYIELRAWFLYNMQPPGQ